MKHPNTKDPGKKTSKAGLLKSLSGLALLDAFLFGGHKAADLPLFRSLRNVRNGPRMRLWRKKVGNHFACIYAEANRNPFEKSVTKVHRF